MPRKKKTIDDIVLTSADEFEDAVKKVIGASKEEVDEKFFEFQASNKAKRDARKREKE